MIIQKAAQSDIDGIVSIYNEIHTLEEQGKTTIGWIRNVYPTINTAKTSITNGEMFVGIEQDKIIAAAKINQEQVPEYSSAAWQYDVDENEIMVLHTLVVSPKSKGNGYGKQFVKFYEDYALKNNCHYLRMDTNAKNIVARSLYKKLGYNEVGIVPCTFNGIRNVRLVCLEKKI